MKQITVREQENGTFEADRDWLGGTPIVGRGRTWKEALGDLLLQSTYEGIEPMDKPPLVLHKDGKPFRFREPPR